MMLVETTYLNFLNDSVIHFATRVASRDTSRESNERHGTSSPRPLLHKFVEERE
jgi:hypothetical protein